MSHPQHHETITELEFEVTDPTEFPVSLSGETAASVRLEQQLRLSDGSFAEYYTAISCPPATVREHAESTEAVEAVHLVGVRDTELTLGIVTTDGGVHATLKRAGTLPRSNVAEGGTGRLVNLVFPGVDPAAVIDAIMERHSGATLVARRFRDSDCLGYTAAGFERTVRERLTARQWEVLQTAYRLGYFKRPRSQTGEEVADRLGISGATFSQHLRAAQRNLLSVLLGDEPPPS